MFKIDSPEWFRDAPCIGKDRLYFSIKPTQRKIAANICVTECNHSSECLNYALTNELHVGVWGGKTGPELVRISEKHAR